MNGYSAFLVLGLAAISSGACAPIDSDKTAVVSGQVSLPPEPFRNRSYVFESGEYPAGTEKRILRFSFAPVVKQGTPGEGVLIGYLWKISFAAFENHSLLDQREATIHLSLDGHAESDDPNVRYLGDALLIRSPLPLRLGDVGEDGPLGDPSKPKTFYRESSSFRWDGARGDLVETRRVYREYSDELIYSNDMRYVRAEEETK